MMKRIKRTLSALLVFVMLVSMAGVVFAEEAAPTLSDIDGNTTVGKSVTELVKLGIINGYEDGTFRPNNTITRGEFAKIIITFKNLASVASDALDSGFPDVDGVNHWAKKYIKLAVDQKIVAGYEDGTFRPDAPVKYVEAVKMIVCALNYGIVAESRNQEGMPWYAGYMAIASEKGILNNAGINSQEDPAPRGTVAVLIYNSLEVVPAQVNVGSTGGVTIKDGGGTALEDLLGKKKVTGVVIGVNQTGLYSGAIGLTERNIIVRTSSGDVTYKVPSGYDTYSLLGYKISGYAEKNDFDDVENITQIAKESQNKLTTITPEMIDSVTSTSISYYPDEQSSRKVSASFNKPIDQMQVIYNGKYLPNPTIDDLRDVKSGKIELLCNNGDGAADVIFVTSYELFVVSTRSILNDGVKVYSLYGAGREIVIPNEGDFVKVTRDGTKVAPSTITNWDVLSVLRSRPSSEGKPVFNCIITRKKVSGRIDEVQSGQGIRIGNTFYEISYLFSEYTGEKPELSLNSQVTVYLDHENKIAAVEENAQTPNVNVGYLVFGEYKSGIGSVAQVRLFNIVGSTGARTYNLASKVKIDGDTISDYNEMLDKLRDASTEANAGKTDFDNELSFTEFSQLIRYTLNSKNEVDMIDTIMPNTSSSTNDLTLSVPFPSSPKRRPADGAYKYVRTNGDKFVDTSNNMVMMINSQTKVLVVPSKVVSADEGFELKTSYTSYFSADNYYRVEGYNVNNVDIAGYILVYEDTGDNVFTDPTRIAMADTISFVADNKARLSGWNVRTNSEIKDLYTESNEVFGGKVDRGEIFIYALNSQNEIKDIQLILEIEDGKPVLRKDGSGDMLAPVDTAEQADRRVIEYGQRGNSNYTKFFYGTVIGREDNIISVSNTLKTDNNGIDESSKENFTIPNSAKVFLYDFTASANDRIKTGDAVSLDEIKTVKDLKTAGADINEASQVLIVSSWSEVKSIIIFKFN